MVEAEVMQPKAVVVELTADPEEVGVILLVLLEQQAKETQAAQVLTHKAVAVAVQVQLVADRAQVLVHQTTMQPAAARHIRAEAKVHLQVYKTAVLPLVVKVVLALVLQMGTPSDRVVMVPVEQL